MMGTRETLITVMLIAMALGQRPSFAPRPIGYPQPANKTEVEERFGDDGTPLKLPIEAGGDRDLVNRLSKLPIDKQPFWFINWQAAERNRQKPQNYPQSPNIFIDTVPSPPVATSFLSNRQGEPNTPNLTSDTVNTPKAPVLPPVNTNTPNTNDKLAAGNANTASNNGINRPIADVFPPYGEANSPVSGVIPPIETLDPPITNANPTDPNANQPNTANADSKNTDGKVTASKFNSDPTRSNIRSYKAIENIKLESFSSDENMEHDYVFY